MQVFGSCLSPSAHVDAWLLQCLRPWASEKAIVKKCRHTAQYLRVSTSQQMTSLKRQREEIYRYAAAHDHIIVATYEDIGRSGVTLQKRAGLSRLLKTVVSGQADFSHLLVLDVSRWGRFQDPDEAAHYEFVCRSNDVAVTYIRDLISSDASGQLSKHVKRVLAADYARQLSTTVRRAKRRRVEAGGAPGAWPRFMASRRVVHPDGTPGRILKCGEFRSAPDQELKLVSPGTERERTVRRIFDLFIEGGRSMSDIAEVLTQEGSLWSDGTAWNRRRVGKVLRHPLATGLQPYGRTRTVLGVRGAEPNPDLWGEFQAFSTMTPIDVFAAAQARFQALDGRPAFSRKEMLDELRRLLRTQGRITTRLIDDCPSLPSFRTIEARFGSLTAACREIGYDRPSFFRGLDSSGYPKSRASVLEGLVRLQSEHGRINLALIRKDRSLPSVYRIRAVFGSLKAAYAEAGL